MIYFFKFDLFIEVIIRVILWSLFVYFDKSDPFVRKINPQEVWQYQYPVTENYVPATDLWIIITIFPTLFLVTEYFIGKNNEDVFNAALGLTLGYSMNGFLTTVLKNAVGRPRPDFYYRCFPDGVGNDFGKCTGSMRRVMDGRKSFPSGHSSFAFTCMAFMSLYIARKVNIMDRSQKGQSWKLCACIVPLLVATLIAVSRTCDYHHHYSDVAAGSILGSVISLVTYWLYFSVKEDSGNVTPEK